jgi:hypothetical protein
MEGIDISIDAMHTDNKIMILFIVESFNLLIRQISENNPLCDFV